MCSTFCVLAFFFFFQAEDGIRDLYVTGVQTCALPISKPTGGCAISSRILEESVRDEIAQPPVGFGRLVARRLQLVRSEERRVGKECRSREAADHDRKKKDC